MAPININYDEVTFNTGDLVKFIGFNYFALLLFLFELRLGLIFSAPLPLFLSPLLDLPAEVIPLKALPLFAGFETHAVL